MHEHALADNLLEAVLLERGRNLEQFYCVEIPVKANLIYQFKIWQTESILKPAPMISLPTMFVSTSQSAWESRRPGSGGKPASMN